MFVPSVFTRVRKDDFTISPFTVYKDYYVLKSQAEDSTYGYTVRQGVYNKKPLQLGYKNTHLLTAPTSSDSTYDYFNWHSLYHLYYRNPYSFSQTLEGYSQNKIHKFLYLTASLISAPYFDMGEGFRPRSVYLTSSNLNLKDDGNGNLVDQKLNSIQFVDDANLDLYLGFQELYLKTLQGYSSQFSNTSNYISNTHGDSTSYQINKIELKAGIEVNGIKTGHKVVFSSLNSYLLVENNPVIDYEFDEDFTLSFWTQLPVSQSVTDYATNTIINKRNLTTIQKTGRFQLPLDDSNTKITRTILSSSIENKPTDIYPYHFETYNYTANSFNRGKIIFKRSDGSSTVFLTSSMALNDGNFHHIGVVKQGGDIKLYIDGALNGTALDVPQQTTNGYHLIFGADDFTGTKQLSGSIDEVRFYSQAFSSTLISSSLAEKTLGGLYQTANAGNVFYKRGEVVLTSPNPKYNFYFNTDQWELGYKNIYTIYEYEALVRIKAGDYNRTMNPSSLKSSKSTTYSEAFTSGSLLPYATTIGLYNDKLQLVAVGKLGRPLKMREDVDINVIVRWDY